MKQVLLFMVCCLVWGCVKSNDQKAKELVEKKLFTTMNDFKSYEAVAFEKLDSAFTRFDVMKYNPTGTFGDLMPKDVVLLIQKEKARFKPKFIGYQMIHTYRQKNEFGATVLEKRLFFFDRSLSRVVSVTDPVERKMLIGDLEEMTNQSIANKNYPEDQGQL